MIEFTARPDLIGKFGALTSRPRRLQTQLGIHGQARQHKRDYQRLIVSKAVSLASSLTG